MAMETRVLIRSGQNLMQPFPAPLMLQMEFNFSWPAGLRDINVKSVNGRIDGCTDAGPGPILEAPLQPLAPVS